MITYGGANLRAAAASSRSASGASFPSGLLGVLVEKLHHLLMGLKGTVEATCSDILRGFGQAVVDDAALLGCALIVGCGELRHQSPRDKPLDLIVPGYLDRARNVSRID